MLQKSGNPYGLHYNDICIPSERLIVRTLQASDCPQWLCVRQRDYKYLQEREPIWDMDALNYQGFDRLIADLQGSFQVGNYYSFGIFDKKSQALVGGFEVSNILFWPKQSASIGYWISQQYSGLGYATEVVKAMTKWGFKALNLVKIEAGTMISNIASQRVLTKAGFVKEGVSQSYGEINGVYEDHILWGLIYNTTS